LTLEVHKQTLSDRILETPEPDPGLKGFEVKTSKLTFTPFKGLREVLEERNFAFHKKNATGKDVAATKTDDEIFRDAMSDVREIKEFRKMPAKRPPKIARVPVRRDDSLDVLQSIVKGETRIRLSDTGEYIEWIRPDIRKDILRRLHHGNFSVQDSIDLHGMTLREAEEAVSSFFKHAIKNRLFCIKVIHGRGLRSPGGPVLKEAFIKWLHGDFRKWVLAYSSAKDCDGGLGATYIILRTG
jgi:DNA-nicking Smr family endonuclease